MGEHKRRASAGGSGIALTSGGDPEIVAQFAAGAFAATPLLRADGPGQEPEAAVMVFDRSAEGRVASRHAQAAFDRQAPHALKAWLESGAPFLAVRFEFNETDLRTARSVSELVREVLPTVLAPLMRRRARTMLALGINPALEACLRSAQEAVTEGMLPQADGYPLAPPAEGEEVDDSLIQIVDPKPAWGWLMSLSLMGTQVGDINYKSTVAPEHRQLKTRAFRQSDGTLHYRIELAGGDALGMRVAASQWKLLTREEYQLAMTGGLHAPARNRH